MSPLISVIVPVYRVEPYLDRCVQSLLGQTLADIEILLIDDGSPDRCGEMCDAYVAGHPDKVRVLHKENGGLSDARNAGLKMAEGKYVSFVDSDDWIPPDMLRVLYSELLEWGADISVCAPVLVYSNRQKYVYRRCSEAKVWDREAAIREMAEGTWFGCHACGKLFPRAFFGVIAFPKGKEFEDIFTTYKLLFQAQKVVLTPTTEYFYFQREESISRSPFNHSQMDWVEASQQLVAFCDRCCPKASMAARSAYVFANLDLLNHALRTDNASRSDIDTLLKNIQMFGRYFVFYPNKSKNFDVKHRAAVLLLWMCPSAYYRLMRGLRG